MVCRFEVHENCSCNENDALPHVYVLMTVFVPPALADRERVYACKGR